MSREPLVGLAYKRLCLPLLKQLEDPAAAQENCLRRILKRCKNTVFGKQHGFAEIKSIKDFQERVPIGSFDSMKPYIERCGQGEQNVLFPDKILIFLETAGTSGIPKQFPLGEHRVQELTQDFLQRSIFYMVHTGNYDVMDGTALSLISPPNTGRRIGPYDIAYFSGAITDIPLPTNLQLLGGNPRGVPPREVSAIRDYEKKAYLTARYAAEADVRTTIGVTANVVSLLSKLRNQYLDRFLADPELDNKTKNRLRQVSQDGIIDLKELWPDFRVFISGGMSVTHHKRIIYDLLGDDIDIWQTYGANEGSLGVQIYPEKGLFPRINRTFFEFIPDEEEAAQPIPLSEVKQGKPYRILLTNNGGFYRYDLGDLVTFSELDPPIFGEISRKTALVNIVGERMSEELFLRALDSACEKFSTSFVDFALLPEITEKYTRHHLFIEFTQPPSDLEEFTAVVDELLHQATIYYEYQREVGVLSKPVITPVEPGGFEAVLLKQGKDPVQSKIPRLLSPELSRLFPLLKSKHQ